MSKPRIYIAIATFHPLVGGSEKQTLMQGRSLHERSYDATIITFRHHKSWLAREVLEGVPVIRVAGMLLGSREKLPRPLQKLLYMMAMVVMGWTLWRHRHHYDILHIYQLNLLVLPAALVCQLTGKPLIIGVRSANSSKKAPSSSKMSLLAGPLDASAPWLQVHERIQVGGDLEDLERFGKPVVQFVRFLLYRINAVVVVLSSRMMEYLAANDFRLPDTVLIPNGVNTILFHPSSEDTSIAERVQVVVCVSTLRYAKGIDVLLQAWHLVHKQIPQAQLIIVGDGPLRHQLVAMAQELGITESVEFTGSQSDVAAQLHRGGLAVLPSRREGMPNALLEAMACGLPCVATRVSGSEDIIQHGVNGLLVEPEDYRGMAQALLDLLQDPAFIQKYGVAARTTIEKHYSLEQIVETYIRLYQRLADHKPLMSEDGLSSESYHLQI